MFNCCNAIAAILIAFCAASASAEPFTGTWQYRGPAGSGMWLKTMQQGSHVRFQLELARGAPSYNSGWIEGVFGLQGNRGTYRHDQRQCEIAFQFNRRSVRIAHAEGKDDCGFGYNVRAEGELLRTRRSNPEFSDGDPRFGKD